ncbi:TPA: winged helix-turn-helix domain-containing protein [Enterobacter hormaechei subsp. xiangfangensis]
MLYVIEGKIHFRDTDGALWKDDENDPETVTLTATTSRLLSYLLEHHGDVASRDDILEAVWSNHGLRSSNNSLNKYIADLRKVFANYEILDEVIITVPKVGFMFSRTIDVEKMQIEDNHEHHLSGDMKLYNETIDHKHEGRKKTKTHYLGLPLFIICLSLMPIILSKTIENLNLWGISTLSQSPYFLLGSINECEIFTLKQNSEEMVKIKLRIAEKIIKQSGLDCIKNTKFFYQPSDPVVYGYPGRIFLARCTFSKDSPHKFAACDNYYGANYTNE